MGPVVRFSRYAPRNGQLGRPTRSLCSAGPESSGSIRCLLLRDLYAQQPRYMRSSHAMPCYAIGFAGLVLARSFGAQVSRSKGHAMANACKLMCNATCDELGTASWSGSLPLKPPAQARECCYRSCCTTHYPVPDGPYLKTYVNLILAPAGARIKLT